MKKERSYKDVEEGGVVVVVQHLNVQLLLNAAVHLSHKQPYEDYSGLNPKSW